MSVDDDSLRGALPELAMDSLDCDLRPCEDVGLPAADVSGVRDLVGLAVPGRVEVNGRLGAAEAVVPPGAVLLVLSALASGRVVREAGGPTAAVLDGRSFSSPPRAVLDAPSSALAPGFLFELGTGRVGGLLIVLPLVRDVSVFGLLGVVAAGVREVVVFLAGAVPGFLGSSGTARFSIVHSADPLANEVKTPETIAHVAVVCSLIRSIIVGGKQCESREGEVVVCVFTETRPLSRRGPLTSIRVSTTRLAFLRHSATPHLMHAMCTCMRFSSLTNEMIFYSVTLRLHQLSISRILRDHLSANELPGLDPNCWDACS